MRDMKIIMAAILSFTIPTTFVMLASPLNKTAKITMPDVIPIIEQITNIEEQDEEDLTQSEESNVEEIESAPVDNRQIKLSDSDRELLAQLLYHEGRGESQECQRAIVSVVINRLNSGFWGDTLYSVIYAPSQFSPASAGMLPGTKPLQAQYDAIDYVCEHGVTIDTHCYYFRASYYFSWGTPYMHIDNTYFSLR